MSDLLDFQGLGTPQVYYLKTSLGLFQDLDTVALEVWQVEMRCSMPPIGRIVLLLSQTPPILTQFSSALLP